MVRLVKNTNQNYTNVSNAVIRDERLSWKARGIFVYLWSQADNWNFYVSEIAKHSIDGEGALQSGLKELESLGYLIRRHRQTKSGVFDGMEWVLTDHDPVKPINGKIKEKTPKKSKNPSDGKSTGWENHPVDNGRLRNNNSKNYQQEELPTESNNKDDDDRVSSQADENPFDVANSIGLNVNSGYHLPIFLDYIDRLGKPLVSWAVHQTDNNAQHPSWSYLVTVLKNLEVNSVRTVEQAEQLSAKHKRWRGHNAPQVRETLPDWFGKDYSKPSKSTYQAPDDSQDVMPDD